MKEDQIIFLNDFVPHNYLAIDSCWIDTKAKYIHLKWLQLLWKIRKQVRKDRSLVKINKVKDFAENELDKVHSISFESIYAKMLNC